MAGVFDEKNMVQILEKYLPAGETLLAGIHGTGLQVKIVEAFRKCLLMGDGFLAAEDGAAFQVIKRKEASFSVYIGITEHSLLVTQCERNKWLYEVDEIQDPGEGAAKEVGAYLPLADIGTCFPLADIQNCVNKKVWMGAVNSMVTFKNGTFFKLQLPTLGGLGGGMPHHKEYRERIIECLGGLG